MGPLSVKPQATALVTHLPTCVAGPPRTIGQEATAVIQVGVGGDLGWVMAGVWGEGGNLGYALRGESINDPVG